MSSGLRGCGRGGGQAGGNQRSGRGGISGGNGQGSGRPRGGGNQQEGSDQRVVDESIGLQGDTGRGGGNQDVGGAKPSKKERNKLPPDRAKWSPKGYDSNKSAKDDSMGLAKDSSTWDVKSGPRSTSFGNAPAPGPGMGSSKGKARDQGKGKGKDQGKAGGEGFPETLGLDPEGPGLEGEVIDAIEVVLPGEQIPFAISAPASPRSFVSERAEEPIRSPSEQSVISFHSELAFDPCGRERYYLKNPDPKTRKALFKHIDRMYEQPRMLNLVPGQGGTFGFGDSFITEKGRKVSGDELTSHPDKLKHLNFFGKNVQLIGTTKCASCTGVYFEIEDGRCFCAHINTWHNPDMFTCDYLETSDSEYVEIVEAVLKRLKIHSKEYGWKPNQVYTNTLRVICPQPKAQAYAVPEALRQFLKLDYTPFIHNAHGFVMTPGARGPDNREVGQNLRVTWGVLKSGDKERDGRRGYVREGFPAGIRCVTYKHSNRDWVVQQWCYTVGQSWHHIDPYYDSRFGRRIGVDLESTAQKFAPWNTMYQGRDLVRTTAQRQYDYHYRNIHPNKWFYTGPSGEPFAIDRPSRLR